MTIEELRDFLLKLGVPASDAMDMARQLDKRARQLSEQRGQSYEQALAGLVTLYRESWAMKNAATSSKSEPSKIQKWDLLSTRKLGSYRVFDLREDTVRSPRTGKEGPVYILKTRDWVNVVVETVEKKLLLIEQYRHGSQEISLEIVGGVIDHGESPTAAARRELREETGYEATDFLTLGVVRPNPAIQNNRAFTVLARGARRIAEPQLEPFEDISMRLVSSKEIPRLISDGKIDHSLVIIAFHWYDLYRAGKLEALAE